MAIKFEKFAKENPITALTGFIGSVALAVGTVFGAYIYLDNSFIDRDELKPILMIISANNEIALKSFQQVGELFYDDIIVDVETAINFLEKKEDADILSNDDKNRLKELRLRYIRLTRDKDEFMSIQLKPLKFED